jgi:hypothetical protein
MFRFSILIISLFLLVSCGAFQSCADYVTQADALLTRWDDNDQLGGIAPVDQVIEARQAFRRKAQGLSVPDCAEPAQTAMIAYFDQVIDTDIAFFQQTKSESEITDMALQRDPLRATLDAELDKLRAN